MTVFVVVHCHDSGRVVGVFSTLEKAAAYCEQHGYSAHIITEHSIDTME